MGSFNSTGLIWPTPLQGNSIIDKYRSEDYDQLTSNFNLADRYVRSAVFCAWHVNVVLWCSFFGISFSMDLAVTRRESGNDSFMYSMPVVSTLPRPSIQVIYMEWMETVGIIRKRCSIFVGGLVNMVHVAEASVSYGWSSMEPHWFFTIYLGW